MRSGGLGETPAERRKKDAAVSRNCGVVQNALLAGKFKMRPAFFDYMQTEIAEREARKKLGCASKAVLFCKAVR